MGLEKKRCTIKPDDLFKYKFIQDGQLSPDGKTVAYTVSHVDAQKDQEFVTIWLLSLETDQSCQFTTGLTCDTKPRWSSDGEWLAFLSERGEKPQIYLMPTHGGEAQVVTDMPQGVMSAPVWSPDGQHIAFTAGPAKPPLNLNQPYRVTRNIYRFNGMGYVDNAIQDIYIISVKGGDLKQLTPKQLTNDDCHNTDPVWSPDGNKILFTTSYWPDSYRIEPGLRVVNIKGEICEIVKDWGSTDKAVWTLDGKRVVFIGNPFDAAFGAQKNLWVVDSRGGKPVCRTSDLDLDVGGVLQPDMPILDQAAPKILITDTGESAIVRVQQGGTIQIYRIALNGKESFTSIAQGLPMDIQGNQLLYSESLINDPMDLFIADVDGSNKRRLTRVNADLLSGFKLPTFERLIFPGIDGVKVEGWIMKPPVGKAPYPTILYSHGGPTGAFGHIFSFDFQMLAGAGYAVLLINFRGSSGYGNEFSTAITGDLGNLDYKDSMAGVDHAIDIGLADPNRLGCCGLSYGGFMSCWIVGQTDRFKAAVPENPVTNWVSKYGVCDIGPAHTPKQMGDGLPHETPDVYSRCSPITYAHNCKTPTLLIQGEADYRCPAEQSEQFYAVLKANGCTVEMLRLPHMPHEGTMGGSIAARRAQNEALLEWMNRYLLGKESL